MCSITEEMKTEVRRDDKGVPLATVTSDVLTVHVGRSVVDGVPYVMIDSDEAGQMRVDLNDGNIWDGDPEQDQAHWLDGFTIFDARGPVCTGCYNSLDVDLTPVSLRAYVAAAKVHVCEARS